MKLPMRLPRHFISGDESGKKEDGSGNGDLNANKPPQKVYTWPIFSSDEKLRSFCWITAFVHFFLMIAAITITILQASKTINIPRLQTPITRNIGIWTNVSELVRIDGTSMSSHLDLNQCPLAATTPAKDSAFVVQQVVLDGKGEIDTRILIIVFHALSFVFQWLSALDANYYTNTDQGKTNLGHFFEYSITASLMLIAMSAQFGITDVFLLMSIAANCTGCMLFGMLAEFLFDHGSKFTINFLTRSKSSKSTKDRDDPQGKLPGVHIPSHWVAHAAGWFMLIFALIASTSNLMAIDACGNSDDVKPPTFVLGLVAVEVFLFACFGFVQMLSFMYRSGLDETIPADLEKKKSYAEYTEFMYILLSLSAKLALGLFVMWGNYSNK
jgi:hypothetical protein